MSIVPASRLSAAELVLLGNNFGPPRRRPAYARRRCHPARRLLATLNRSLACVNERIDHFTPPAAARPGSAVGPAAA